jgi:hypothetical protein
MSPVHSPFPTKDLSERDAQLLEQAIVKLVLYGTRVGVTPEEMISLLDSGMSMSGLLAFLATKGSGTT